jgi:hypothetical protein
MNADFLNLLRQDRIFKIDLIVTETAKRTIRENRHRPFPAPISDLLV